MQKELDKANPSHSLDFPTGYAAILEKIQAIQPLQYAKTRNFIDGAVTGLSPYLSRGVISLQKVKDAILQKGYAPRQVEKLLQELAWREYYQRIWQVRGDRIWEDLKHPQPDILHHQMVTAVQEAATGITAIDREIKNLYATGYLHNHIRMYVASITCNIAKAHWLQPSRWLYYHLLDGDIASNNCSWQWVAGAFANKKYFCNQENINTYTHSQQTGTFLDTTYEQLPALPVPHHLTETNPLPLSTILPETGLPVIDTTLPTLLYHSYNLDPAWRIQENVNRVLLLEPTHFKKYPVSPKVIDCIIELSKNIPGIQVYCGEIESLLALYKGSHLATNEAFISKEHPAFTYYPGRKDSRDWMYPDVTGAYPSFFSYWKKCERHLKKNLF